MNVGQLKKLLEQYPDSMPVMVWNGFVSDVQPTRRVIPSNMYKMKFEDYVRYCNLEDGLSPNAELTPERLDYLKKCHRKYHSYELDEAVDSDPVYATQFNKKKILVLEPGKAGNTTFDRIGEMKY